MIRSTTKESLGTMKFSYEGTLNFATQEEPTPDPGTEYPVLTEAIRRLSERISNTSAFRHTAARSTSM